ncbi:MAG: hypothetical protein LBK95_20645 [Bifidobacteriaceae bacterium]|jgi:hypothetical protein|nr:hypothetical protein [Bifidobacteriaceae bacterium]
MVDATFLEQAKAMSVEDRWTIVDTLLDTLEPGPSAEELEIARDGLRRHRANPEATVDADMFFDALRFSGR